MTMPINSSGVGGIGRVEVVLQLREGVVGYNYVVCPWGLSLCQALWHVASEQVNVINNIKTKKRSWLCPMHAGPVT